MMNDNAPTHKKEKLLKPTKCRIEAAEICQEKKKKKKIVKRWSRKTVTVVKKVNAE